MNFALEYRHVVGDDQPSCWVEYKSTSGFGEEAYMNACRKLFNLMAKSYVMPTRDGFMITCGTILTRPFGNPEYLSRPGGTLTLRRL
jgi:hypothetical protein